MGQVQLIGVLPPLRRGLHVAAIQIVPQGLLNLLPPVSAVPAGLFISPCLTQDSVLGYFQVAPSGLELQSLVLTRTLRPLPTLTRQGEKPRGF